MSEKEVYDKIVTITMYKEEEKYKFLSSFETARENVDKEIELIQETIDSVAKLKPDCDKIDYALAASSGILCGLIDIFLVGKPGDSVLGDKTDKWFENKVKGFAGLCGWKDGQNGSLKSAIRHLEKKFKIPYDQTGVGDAGREVFGLSPKNHHFKSLGHNPTIMGLFFSILDQFYNQSSFFLGETGELIVLQDADGQFYLRGNNIITKIVAGFVNWFGHCISDVSGSSGSTERGMGIPSPIWSWINDIMALKNKLNLETRAFEKKLYEIAIEIYQKGYDFRFQATQTIPVVINEILVRFLYMVRRMIRFFSNNDVGKYSLAYIWKECEPLSNASVKRMLTVAHGVLCMSDLVDAFIRSVEKGGGVVINPIEFVLRLNIVGVGRFAISLFGEGNRELIIIKSKSRAEFARREKIIIDDYIKGLEMLADVYNDCDMKKFINDFMDSSMYKEAFNESVALARKRGVPEELILKNKKEIDEYFGGY